jgi:16S rRNA (cytosine1407-C5)-methyltransferase
MKRKKKTTVAETTPAEWEKTSLQRFQPLLSADEFELLTNELQHPLQPSFRINPLKMKPEGVLQLAKRYHWMLAPIPFCPTGYRLKEASASVSLSQTLEHRMGQYYIQEAASMIPVELFHLDADLPGLFLDLAASPGGKTTHLVSRGGDRSLVIANDSSAGRIPALQIVLQNWGAVNQMITQFPGEKYGMWFPEAFDRVLIDAPCSMQGLRTTESHETRPVTDREILALSKRQVSLLTSALQAVKVGGEVVYSTCTLVPEEDEAVIDQILDRFGDQVEVLQTGISAPGLLSDGNFDYHPEVERSLRLWPNRLHTAGFFACLLRKTSSFDLPTQPPPSRPLERTGFSRLSQTGQSRLAHVLLKDYGFDLAALMEELDLVLVSYRDRRFAFPRRMLSQFADLPVQSAGLPIGDESPDGFIPAHAWVSRFFDLFTEGRVVVPEEAVSGWLNFEDLPFEEDTSSLPAVVIMTDPAGRYLGRGKLTGHRIRNLLPRHSR